MRVDHFSLDGAFETTEFEPTSEVEDLTFEFNVAADTQSLFVSVTAAQPEEAPTNGATRVDLGHLRDGEFEALDYAAADQDLVRVTDASIVHYAAMQPAEGQLVLRIRHEGQPGAVVSLTRIKRGVGRRILDRIRATGKCQACIALIRAIIRFLIAKLTAGAGTIFDFGLPDFDIPDWLVEKLAAVFGIDPETLEKIFGWLRDFLKNSPIKLVAKKICEKLGLC